MVETRYFSALTGIRFIAVLLVYLRHFTLESNFHPKETVGLGQIGVAIFFVLSGFLMMHVTSGINPTPKNVLAYIYNRFAKIYPPFLITIICWAIFSEIYNMDYFGMNESKALSQIFLFSGFGVFWTIPIEFAFYLVFPILWLTRKNEITFGIICTISILLALYFRKNGWLAYEFGFQPLNLLFFIGAFLIGAMSYLFANLNTNKILSDIVFVLTLIMTILYTYINYSLIGKNLLIWNNTEALLLIGFLILFSTKSRIARTILGAPIPVFLGTISYSMYLTHHFVLFYAFRVPQSAQFVDTYLFTHSPVLTGVLLFCLSVLLAWCTCALVELPAQKFLRKHRDTAITKAGKYFRL